MMEKVSVTCKLGNVNGSGIRLEVWDEPWQREASLNIGISHYMASMHSSEDTMGQCIYRS